MVSLQIAKEQRFWSNIFGNDFSPFKKYHKALHNIFDESKSDMEKIAHSLFSESNSWTNGYGQESMDKRLKVDLQNP